MTAPMIDESCRGVIPICVTPFRPDGALDLESADRMVDFYLSCDVAGLTILGVMGEANKMTQAEAEAYAARVVARVAGRVPVVVGVTSPSLTALRGLAESAMAAGAGGVMVQPMQGLRGDEAVYEYFAAVFQALGPAVPVCLQDYPLASGVFVPVPILERLVDAFPQLVMLKHEDVPGLGKLSRIREGERQDTRRRLSILVGNNALYLPQELARGADGAMTGFAYPDVIARVCRLFAAGEAERAEDLFDAYLPLNRYEFQPGIGLALRKEILRRRGAIASASARYPAPRLTPADTAELDALIARAERRAAALNA